MIFPSLLGKESYWKGMLESGAGVKPSALASEAELIKS
jgi:hypothetical protein